MSPVWFDSRSTRVPWRRSGRRPVLINAAFPLRCLHPCSFPRPVFQPFPRTGLVELLSSLIRSTCPPKGLSLQLPRGQKFTPGRQPHGADPNPCKSTTSQGQNSFDHPLTCLLGNRGATPVQPRLPSISSLLPYTPPPPCTPCIPAHPSRVLTVPPDVHTPSPRTARSPILPASSVSCFGPSGLVLPPVVWPFVDDSPAGVHTSETPSDTQTPSDPIRCKWHGCHKAAPPRDPSWNDHVRKHLEDAMPLEIQRDGRVSCKGDGSKNRVVRTGY